jgi:hypothetical protein
MWLVVGTCTPEERNEQTSNCSVVVVIKVHPQLFQVRQMYCGLEKSSPHWPPITQLPVMKHRTAVSKEYLAGWWPSKGFRLGTFRSAQTLMSAFLHEQAVVRKVLARNIRLSISSGLLPKCSRS